LLPKTNSLSALEGRAHGSHAEPSRTASGNRCFRNDRGLRALGELVDGGLLAGLGVHPSAFAPVVHPHIIILLASRCFLMLLMAANVPLTTSAAAATTIHMRDIICMPLGPARLRE
jgi:hypothetical protein